MDLKTINKNITRTSDLGRGDSSVKENITSQRNIHHNNQLTSERLCKSRGCGPPLINNNNSIIDSIKAFLFRGGKSKRRKKTKHTKRTKKIKRIIKQSCKKKFKNNTKKINKCSSKRKRKSKKGGQDLKYWSPPSPQGNLSRRSYSPSNQFDRSLPPRNQFPQLSLYDPNSYRPSSYDRGLYKRGPARDNLSNRILPGSTRNSSGLSLDSEIIKGYKMARNRR